MWNTTASSPSLLTQPRKAQHSCLELNLLQSKCQSHLLHQSHLRQQSLIMVSPFLILLPPQRIQQAPFSSYRPSSPDYYAGEYLDASSGLDSEGWQLKSTPDWHKIDMDCGSYCPKGKKFSCKRPPTIKVEKFPFKIHIWSKSITILGNAQHSSWPPTQIYYHSLCTHRTTLQWQFGKTTVKYRD